MSDDYDLPRRLMTILSADVVGYTHLSEENEASTHRALQECLDRIAEAVRDHRGKVVHFAGDAVLAHFPAVSNALDCAVEIQKTMQARDAWSDTMPMRFRIGINVGDVIVDRGEIYGDAVNTAVRLQALAEPGGICISEAVRNAIGHRLPMAYEYVGERKLKNVSVPVRAYRALFDTGPVPLPPPESEGKPAIAVLPFESLSDDPKQGYFADGLTEDVIRELSRFHGIVVIAHHSTFTYKGRSVKMQDVAEELGVDFVVEGHVRRAGEHLRVNVQLVDAISGHHVWSERYDKNMEDVFPIEDDIVRRIVSALAGRVHVAGGEVALRRPSHQVRIFDHVLRGQALVGKGQMANAEARAHYAHALALLPTHARALTGVALSYIDDWWNGWSDPDETLAHAFDAASRAYADDSDDGKVSWTLGLVFLLRGERDEARRLLTKAVELNPNDADAFAALALYHVHAGEADAARSSIATANALNPFPSAWYRWIDGMVHFAAGAFDNAEQALRDACERNPNLVAAREHLIATFAALGRTEDLRDALEQFLERVPDASIDTICIALPRMSPTVRTRIEETWQEVRRPTGEGA